MPLLRFTRISGPDRVAGAAGAAAAVAAGALAIALATADTHAISGPSTPRRADASPIALTFSEASNSFQPEIDQLIAAQQQVAAINAALPYIDKSDLPMLHEFLTMQAATVLAFSLGQTSADVFNAHTLPWAPYAWGANGANPQAYLVYNNPDNLYSPLPVHPDDVYTINVNPGPGTEDVTFDVTTGNGVGTPFVPLRVLDLADATPNADGSYTLTLSSTPPASGSGNWIDISGADRVVIRDSIGDWGLQHDTFSLTDENGSSALNLPVFSPEQMSTLLSDVAHAIPLENPTGSYLGQVEFVDRVAIKSFSPIAETTNTIPGPLLPDQLTSFGHFSLQSDQALIVKVPDIDAAYSSIMLADDWGRTAPWATGFGSLNNTQAFHDPDGFTYYVISSNDPGVANWVDDTDLPASAYNGGVWLRWQNVTGPVPAAQITTQVVDVADVKQYLPADTPIVTPAERATDLQGRLFEFDYAHDQAHGIAWVGANIEYDQIKTALGPDQFQAIFGGQQDVPSVLDRMTDPTLIPDLGTVGHQLLSDPQASLTALINNVPLAIQDIELPMILALARLELAIEPTGGFGQILTETLTDPATSITAGLLNARDDLAVAIMNASPATSANDLLWDQLSQLNQAVLNLFQHAAGGAMGTALLDPADFS
ncbi:hypothetical protein KV112_02440 [Mycolicibacter sp. MYC123]|uniref:DUF1214 domain-containing protein n=1 Tax=[Mycobacterium] zoologicum TaxID=2872311 RepID=A0ABU5YEY5_9MYCO|nr:hypothetical protein [Mycolicibacter sp. MYC123]MEB3048604.1 hypothetical protein [Mycolicibacter sp. MYC123]